MNHMNYNTGFGRKIKYGIKPSETYCKLSDNIQRSLVRGYKGEKCINAMAIKLDVYKRQGVACVTEYRPLGVSKNIRLFIAAGLGCLPLFEAAQIRTALECTLLSLTLTRGWALANGRQGGRSLVSSYACLLYTSRCV